jgi:hypothetical protein
MRALMACGSRVVADSKVVYFVDHKSPYLPEERRLSSGRLAWAWAWGAK